MNNISSSLTASLLDYLDGTSSSTSDDFSTSILPTGTYTKLAAAKYLKDNDTDHDGVLESDEVSISAEAYAALDANSDGKVTEAEIQDSLAGDDDAIFQYYSSGAVSGGDDLTSELLSASNATATSNSSYSALAAKRLLAKLDSNGDSLLTQAEADLTTSVFDDIDSNSDGDLSLSELKSALASKNSTITRYYKDGGTASLSDLASRLLTTI